MTRTKIDIPLPSLTGRRAVVTGGSDGVGLRIATRLAMAGAEVVLPVRNVRKGESAAAAVRASVPGARIELHDLDLSSLASIASFGEAMRRDGRPLHLLINNAGVMTPPSRQATTDGFELQFGTNHLGHFALVAHLLPVLRAGAGRVTSQVSIAVSRGGINWNDLQWQRSYDGMRAYRQSKIALGLFACELDRRSADAGWGITSNLSHPGVAPTSLLSARPEMGRAADTAAVRAIRWASARGLAGTPETASLPALYAATSPDAAPRRLYGPRGIGHVGGAPAEQPLYRTLRKRDDAARMWAVSEELTETAFVGP
ncbi:SDR family oxidoreductase [Microbacterium sp. CPCC 204701]|uniref:SDR family oxidoreductase n=1 Tax=Microbacterium sp. CPCC 204701 TaxID=2493084 RepID=UPI000FDA5172|nr:SDR family oxidoreductase [Microbacterium sp. CPCC 204701]